MARLTFPDEGSRSAFRTAPSGRPLTSAAGAAALVYLDAAATTLADIQTTAGAAIAGSSLNLDAYSRFPLFLGPADGTDTLYVVVDGGPVSPMYARVDDRLDAVKATADAAETPAGAAAKVSAEATTRASADSAEATARASAVTAAIATAATDATTKANAAVVTAGTNASGAYRPKNPNAKISALYAGAGLYAYGAVVAHRLGPMVHPENTFQAARACVEAGIPMLQFNSYTAADGTRALMHDATIDRTTTASGNITSETTVSLSQRVLDPVTYTGPGLANITGIPLTTHMLDEFGGQVALMIEIMDTRSITQHVNDIVSRGLQQYVIMGSRILSALAEFTAAGIPTLYIDDTGTTNTPAALVAAGVTAVALKTTATPGSGVTQATINALRAAGLKIEIHTVQRQAEFLGLYTAGTIDFIACDDPFFLHSVMYNNNRHRVTADIFGLGFFAPGMLPGAANAAVGTYRDANGRGRGNIVGGRWQIDAPNPGVTLWNMLGPYCPLANPAACTISFSIGFDTADTTTSSWAAIFVGAADDTSYNDGAGLVAANSGYQFLVRQTGSMEHNRIDAGVSTAGATQATAALTTGSVATFTLQITATQLILTRTDSGGFTPLTITHSSYRGGYMHWGVKCNTGNGRYSIKITSIT